MEDDDSAAVTEPINTGTSSCDADLLSEIEKLKLREEELRREKLETENDFSSKRARFMKLFKQKEDELESEREVAALLQSECDNYAVQISSLQTELDEYKSQIAVIECTRENEIDDQKVKVQQELASLHQVIRDTMAESSRTKKGCEREVKKLKKVIEKLETEIQELKSQNPGESSSKEGVLSVVTKTLAKKVSVLNAYSQSNENIHENLEESMKKAQEDAEVLRSLVVPLEEEIRALKEKLRAADDQIQTYESVYKSLESSTEGKDCKTKPELGMGKFKGLQEGLEAEKSSRSDLEMYVSVLQGQKASLMCETDDLRKQLRDVCHLFEKEKREHNELKQTWQMANDQFLEAQKIHAEDMRRMNDILTLEQQRILAGMKRESREHGHHTSLETADVTTFRRASPISFLTSPHRRKSPSPARLPSSLMEKSADEDIPAEGERGKICESVSSESDVGSDHEARVQSAAVVDETKRIPNEKEWLLLQDELKTAKEKLNQPCDMCANYETQLQKAQEIERDLKKSIKAFEQSNEWLKSDLETEQQMRKGLEEQLEQNSTEIQGRLAELYLKMGESEQTLMDQKQMFERLAVELNARLKDLTKDRELVQNNLTKVRQENEVLMGKYLTHSNQLQNEMINLPDTVAELQEMHLRLREELIVALTSKEHTEELLRSEMLVMKERAQGEQQIRESTERLLMQEIDNLRENVGILESMKATYLNEEKRRTEAEQRLSELQKKSAETQAMHKTILHNLQRRVEDGAKEKEKLEAELSEMRMKLYTLQRDLDSGEAVQRDFVKLSQSLQVQLEGIRKAEEEVRWQHEDDVDECNNCKQAFSMTRRKHHCRHCGRIFCADCSAKVVLSGSNSRPSKVCDLCHTLLVPSTAPYFSTEVPHGAE